MPVSPEHGWFDLYRFISEVDKIGVQISKVHTDALLTVVMFDYMSMCLHCARMD